MAYHGHKIRAQKGIRWMRVCHGFAASFDDPNLVSCAGVFPVLELAERAGLQRLVAEHVRLNKPGGVNAHLKVPGLVAGMIAGADSIDDMALLRHGAMGRLTSGVRAPSTLGTFLRTFTFGHVRQLDAVNARLLIGLAARAPLLPAAAELAYVDVDDTIRQTYGYAKQGAGRGYTGVKGLNALIAVVSTPSGRPVIAAARLRKGSTNSVKGAHRLIADALVTATAAGATGIRVLRADSAFYGHDIIAACHRHHSRFSITARQDPAVRTAIASIDPDSWTAIKYTDAIYDEAAQQWISDAEVAEIDYTAFTSRAKAKHVTARLIVRRVPDRNPAHQNELFTAYRYHAVFTDTPLPMLEAEKAHRAHAIIEQVIAELKNGPLAHLPSGHFWANSAWLVCAAMAFNLTRAAGTLASAFHAKATTATLRPPDLCSRPARPLRTTAHPAPAAALALGRRVPPTAAPQPTRTTNADLTLTTRRQAQPGDPKWTNRPDRLPNRALTARPRARHRQARRQRLDGGSRLSLQRVCGRGRGRRPGVVVGRRWCQRRDRRGRADVYRADPTGISRVVFVWREPSVFVDCHGAELLAAAGVEVVEIPELADAAREPNRHLLGG